MSLLLLLLSLMPAPTDPVVTVGEPMIAYTLPDQHGTSFSFTPGTRWVLFAFEKKGSGAVNDWLKEAPAYLTDHHMDYVVEISPMPGIIANKIALPKMRKYPHRVLVADDASFQVTYLKKPKHLTLFQLDEAGMVQAVHYPESPADVQKLIADNEGA